MLPTPRVLVFDIFGTVVDWHGSIVAEVSTRYPKVDADAFVVMHSVKDTRGGMIKKRPLAH